jgi:hypothetical protein
MALPQSRRDSYGRPIQPLTEARQELLLDRPQNQAQRRFLVALLEEQMPQILRRGMYVDVVLRFAVQNGIIQNEIDLVLTRHLRHQAEE